MEKCFNSKKEIESAIKRQITISGAQSVKALLRIYDGQTISEQIMGRSNSVNRRGFDIVDSETLSEYAKACIEGHTLSQTQMADLQKKIAKYAGQLVRRAIANGIYVKEGKKWKIAKKN